MRLIDRNTGCPRSIVCPRRRRPAGRAQRPSAAAGQTLVEVALVLPIFLLLTLGLLDSFRVILYYTQVQEAAREGARWGAVQVGRATSTGSTPWGTFADQGNYPTTYCNTCSGPGPGGTTIPYTVPGSRTTSSGSTTVVGAVTTATTAVNLSQATITISTTIPSGATETLQTFDDHFSNRPVSVTVTYPFTPIVGKIFGGISVKLTGTSTMLHE